KFDSLRSAEPPLEEKPPNQIANHEEEANSIPELPGPPHRDGGRRVEEEIQDYEEEAMNNHQVEDIQVRPLWIGKHAETSIAPYRHNSGESRHRGCVAVGSAFDLRGRGQQHINTHRLVARDRGASCPSTWTSANSDAG